MEGKRFVRTLRLTNFLSYGPASQEIALGPLNVLIGPNASGKSNLIEALSLLQASPVDLAAPIREGGGVAEWLWKGPSRKEAAEIDVTVHYPEGSMPLRHRISFSAVGQKFDLEDEAIENEHRSSPSESDVYFYYRYQHGRPTINTRSPAGSPVQTAEEKSIKEEAGPYERGSSTRYIRSLKRETINPNQSILALKRDADVYPELTYLGDHYRQIRIYREWSFGRNTTPRRPQQVDLPDDFLLEDASNIALILNDLDHRGTRSALLKNLRLLYEDIENISTKVHGGTIQVFVHEKDMKNGPIPGTRISDGMMRFLCLISILCHPSPPPLVCIEEPELGLHPDIMPTIGELLIDAAQRTQLIVTTHSDALVSALSEVPDTVLVCERDEKGTQLRRLELEPLKQWLEKYKLGDLWRMGELGGTRW